MDQAELMKVELLKPSEPRLAELQRTPGYEVVDALPEALVDLFKVRFPHIAVGSPEAEATRAVWLAEEWNDASMQTNTVWAHFPWKRCLVHLPKEEIYHELRTTRNKFLITAEEQDKFYNANLGIAGMSVGSSVLNTIVLSGGGRNLRLADLDVLSITNLNRLFGSVCDLGRAKITASVRRAYEMNPFAQIETFPEGMTTENLDRFLTGLDVYIEEMDNIYLKIISRQRAKELKVPVVMATDNGDNTIIDVERFDLEPDRPIFHGKADDELLATAEPEMPMGKKVALANAIVGSGVTPRMQYSLTQVGQLIPAWPQLGNAAVVSGAATSYVVRRIVTGAPMPSGRYYVDFDRDIDPDFHTEEAKAARAAHTAEFELGFDLLFKRAEEPL